MWFAEGKELVVLTVIGLLDATFAASYDGNSREWQDESLYHFKLTS